MILAVLVHAANIGDRDGARVLLCMLVGHLPRLIHLRADHGSTGPLKEWINDLLWWDIDVFPTEGNESRHTWRLVNSKPVVKVLPPGGFQIQRHRWNVERACGWLIRSRRLAREYEG